MIGIIGRQLPQRLLPPHAADQKAKDPVPKMSRAALTRDRGEGINRDREAREHEHPKHRGRPRRTGREGRLLQEIDDIGNGIVIHLRPSAYFASSQVFDPTSLTATFEKKTCAGWPLFVPRCSSETSSGPAFL